jgi:hypothetical protein
MKSTPKEKGESISMLTLPYARMWLEENLGRDEEGQAATEYVLVMLGVALFLVFGRSRSSGCRRTWRPGISRTMRTCATSRASLAIRGTAQQRRAPTPSRRAVRGGVGYPSRGGPGSLRRARITSHSDTGSRSILAVWPPSSSEWKK